MVEAKKNPECGRNKEQCSPARVVSGKENLKSLGNQGRVYGEWWGMFFSKVASKGLPRPFNTTGWKCSYDEDCNQERWNGVDNMDIARELEGHWLHG